MFAILAHTSSLSSLSNDSHILRDEKIIGLFETNQRAMTAASSLAHKIFNLALSFTEEDDALPTFDSDKTGIRVTRIPTEQEAREYLADLMIHDFIIKEIYSIS